MKVLLNLLVFWFSGYARYIALLHLQGFSFDIWFCLLILWSVLVDCSNPHHPNICVHKWRRFEVSTRPFHNVIKQNQISKKILGGVITWYNYTRSKKFCNSVFRYVPFNEDSMYDQIKDMHVLIRMSTKH